MKDFVRCLLLSCLVFLFRQRSSVCVCVCACVRVCVSIRKKECVLSIRKRVCILCQKECVLHRIFYFLLLFLFFPLPDWSCKHYTFSTEGCVCVCVLLCACVYVCVCVSAVCVCEQFCYSPFYVSQYV